MTDKVSGSAGKESRSSLWYGFIGALAAALIGIVPTLLASLWAVNQTAIQAKQDREADKAQAKKDREDAAAQLQSQADAAAATLEGHRVAAEEQARKVREKAEATLETQTKNAEAKLDAQRVAAEAKLDAQRETDRKAAELDKQRAVKAVTDEKVRIWVEEQKRANVPKVEPVTCQSNDDIWDSACAKCHRTTRPKGIKVHDLEDTFQFKIRTSATVPVTITGATVEVYRVKFLQRHYTFSPTSSFEAYTAFRMALQDGQCDDQYQPLGVSPRPEFKSTTIIVPRSTDTRFTLLTKSLGQVDVTANETISLTFVLSPEWEKDISKLHQNLVQLLATVAFSRANGELIRSEPFLITLRVSQPLTKIQPPLFTPSTDSNWRMPRP
jgi:hypothetical protein